MVPTGQLQNILLNRPYDSQYKDAWLHALKSVQEIHKSWSLTEIETLARWIFSHPHWVQHADHWQHQSLDFARHILEAQNLSIKDHNHAADFLGYFAKFIVSNLNDVQEKNWICENYLASEHSNLKSIKLLQDQPREAQSHHFGLGLTEERELQVHIFNHQMAVARGQIQPLWQNLSLKYSSDLNLKPGVLQLLPLNTIEMCLFKVDSELLVSGALLTLPQVQITQTWRQKPLADIGRLFYKVKRIEQHFINRKTDPFYNEILFALERTSQLLKVGDTKANEWALDVYMKAQTAYENVYFDDKLLGLAIEELKRQTNIFTEPQIFANSSGFQETTQWTQSALQKPTTTQTQKQPNQSPETASLIRRLNTSDLTSF